MIAAGGNEKAWSICPAEKEDLLARRSVEGAGVGSAGGDIVENTVEDMFIDNAVRDSARLSRGRERGGVDSDLTVQPSSSLCDRSCLAP